MKQITNKEYEEWQKYKAEKAKGRILLPDTVRFICEGAAMTQKRSASISLKSSRRSAHLNRDSKTPPSRCDSEALLLYLALFVFFPAFARMFSAEYG